MGKKLMLLLTVLALAGATAQVGRAAELITAVAHRNTDSDAPEDPQIADDLLDEGALTFVDRTHIYVEIPESLIGAEYVMLANDNKNQSAYELDLTISRNATVYVLVDNRMGGQPGGDKDVVPNIDGMPWLGDLGFVDTGLDVGIDESADGDIDQYFSVFALDVKAGITTIFGNTQGHGGNMLGVAVMSRTPAESAHTPSPENEAVDVPRDLIVSWEPGEEVTAHDVYLGASFEDVNSASRSNPMDLLLSQGQSGTTLDVGRLEFEQTYYWRVDEVLTDGSIYHGEVWSFTVEPFAYEIEGVVASSNAASDPGVGPERTVDGSGLNDDDQHSVDSTDMWLGVAGAEPVWLQYEFDRVYKLYEMLVWNYNVMFEPVLGFGVKDVTIEYSEDGAEWMVLGDAEFAQATARADYVANTAVDMAGVAAKFVKITVNSNYGSLPQYGLSEVRFLQIPVVPREPEPAAGATNVGVDSVLSWRAGREAAAHDVYFGTDAEALTLTDTTDVASYDPGALNLETTYYWRIDEVNEAEAISLWEGDVWSFETQQFLVVDDFESYDDEDNRIYDTWLDGWVNETGSTVGHFEAPFAEQTIVNSGSQSMPLFYDNTSTATSEAD
ncbi:MAG: discoidin domain-containing protein, partial [Phycisphaerales bacterium]